MKPREMLCPKCGSLDVRRAYKETVNMEYIAHQCRTCQYAWKTSVFDPKLDEASLDVTVELLKYMGPELLNLFKRVTGYEGKLP